MPTNTWFDAHLDLAYLAETGRDLHTAPSDARGRHQPVAVTLPSLSEGRVTRCLATIFTEPTEPDDVNRETGDFAYDRTDTLAAWKSGMRQLKLYHAWRDANAVQMLPPRNSHADPSDAPLQIAVLMENADPIESPDQLQEWSNAGVRAIGLCWALASRYAGGNATDMNAANIGISPMGRELVSNIDRLGIVHDASHLSQRAVQDLFDLTDTPVIASHSNCRALMGADDDPKTQRHLRDDTIREIARRGGIVGLNLLSDFLSPALARGKRATIADCVAHIEHICELTGSRSHIGLGSDMDGGFGADRLPEGIDTPADLDKIAEALRSEGWSDADIAGFTHKNWNRFWGWDA